MAQVNAGILKGTLNGYTRQKTKYFNARKAAETKKQTNASFDPFKDPNVKKTAKQLKNMIEIVETRYPNKNNITKISKTMRNEMNRLKPILNAIQKAGGKRKTLRRSRLTRRR